MAQPVAEVQAHMEQLERELAEIELLLQQTRTEAERQDERRRQAAERLPALERSTVTPLEALNEARQQLLTLTRRAAMMDGQIQVLEGKYKALARSRDFLSGLLPTLGSIERPEQASEEAPPQDARAVLAAAEELRRDIARQMHDGPAQSMANIALQAQVVERLMQREPGRAQEELGRLTKMVQHTLEATKNFIFDVRPMVLDDLGLVATLRRAGVERSRRSGVPVRFESVGRDQRLNAELESGLFRIVDDALAGFIGGHPTEVSVRLDWTDTDVRAHVRSQPPNGVGDQEVLATAAATDETDMPPALASILREQREFEAARQAERRRAAGLPENAWHEIKSRASALGIEATLEAGGMALEVTVGLTA